MSFSLRKINLAVCFCTIFLLSMAVDASAQSVAVKTNALMWLGLTPNLGCEIVTGEHTSVDFSMFGHKNPYGLTSEVIGIQPKFRYWFNGRPMIREFIGAGMLLTSYDTTIGRNVYDGDAIGLGLIGGYVFSLGKRWNLELTGSFGLVFFRQKRYFDGDNYDDYYIDISPRANSWGYSLFPVDLGVTFTYIIK